MHQQRMEHLRTVMIGVRDANLPFHWSTWFRPALPDEIEAVKAPTPFCETAACVLGYAALDPEFNAQGLHVVEIPHKDGIAFGLSIRLDGSLGGKRGAGGYRSPFDLGMEFFQIDEPTADYLFTPEGSDVIADEVASDDVNEAIHRIEMVLAGYRPVSVDYDGMTVEEYREQVEQEYLEQVEQEEEVHAV